MGKLHVILATTLDGFIATEDGGMDWIIMGDERADFMVEAIRNADTLLMGRNTYEGFASFWPDAPDNPTASPAERTIGAQFNAMRKVVFSRSLEGADWQGTSIHRSIDPDEIRRLKAESEQGIRLDGSISIVQQMTRLGLIDEYQFMVHPVALGAGRPLFEERVDLELIHSEQLRSGVVVLTYRPAREGRPD
ncbi:MAG TPA: dihydrofolate reductase family protein [Longimicrobiales bacterium]|nr:dihydrofolate reductase family protein [Longimicrobiales bacterium]